MPVSRFRVLRVGLPFLPFLACTSLNAKTFHWIDYSLSYWFVLWISLLVLALGFVSAHGVAYVSWPRLNPLADLIEYDGPGFKGERRGRGLGMITAPGLRQAQLMKRRVPAKEIEMGVFEKKRVD